MPARGGETLAAITCVIIEESGLSPGEEIAVSERETLQKMLSMDSSNIALTCI